MNWNSHEFIWLDWVVLFLGVVLIGWAVMRSISKEKRREKNETSGGYFLGKANLASYRHS